MARPSYASSVFVNCPFDHDYQPLRDALVFSIYSCGFVPRCALEENDSGDVRIEKIHRLITDSKFAIHDISRTQSDPGTGLPRFNMPLELGLFLGAKRYGQKQQRQKRCLILDAEQYRYQAFISDISGQDIESHDCQPRVLISKVRNWLNHVSRRQTIPGGAAIHESYQLFLADLPDICAAARIEIDELTYNDYSLFVSSWLSRYEIAANKAR